MKATDDTGALNQRLCGVGVNTFTLRSLVEFLGEDTPKGGLNQEGFPRQNQTDPSAVMTPWDTREQLKAPLHVIHIAAGYWFKNIFHGYSRSLYLV